jgi:hypothetical protein
MKGEMMNGLEIPDFEIRSLAKSILDDIRQSVETDETNYQNTENETTKKSAS